MDDEILSESKALETRLEERLRVLESRLERIQRLKVSQQSADRRRNGRRNRAKSTEVASNRRNIYQLLPNRDEKQLLHIADSLQKRKGSDDEELGSNSRDENPSRVIHAEPVSRQDWLLSRLRTNRYFWDTPQPSYDKLSDGGIRVKRENTIDRSRFLPLNHPISAVSGILLESDMPAMNERLDEIRQTINDLKSFSLNAPSADYHRLISTNKLYPALMKESEQSTNIFTNIKARILNMEFHIERRIREITARRVIQVSMRDSQTVSQIKSKQLVNNKHKIKDETVLEVVAKPSKPLADHANDIVENISKRRIIIAHEEEQPATNEKSQGIEENQANSPPNTKTASNTITQPGTVQISNAQTTEILQKSSSNKTNIVQPPPSDIRSTHYDRMLELLRRPQFNVSSSSSSEDEAVATTKLSQNQQRVEATRSIDSQPVTAIVQTGNAAAVNPPNRAHPFAASATKVGGSDSESDFFH